jgi:hypothetical protein
VNPAIPPSEAGTTFPAIREPTRHTVIELLPNLEGTLWHLSQLTALWG